MSLEELAILIDVSLDISIDDTYAVGNVEWNPVANDNENYLKLFEKFKNSHTYTWKLMHYLIINQCYPTCTFCGEKITVIDGNHPHGLTKGHFIADKRGGSRTLDNLLTEHNECNISHGIESIKNFPMRLINERVENYTPSDRLRDTLNFYYQNNLPLKVNLAKYHKR